MTLETDASDEENLSLKKYLELYKKEVASLIDPATKKLKEEFSVKRSCVLCNSNQSKTLFLKDGFTFVKFMNMAKKGSYQIRIAKKKSITVT